MTIQREILLCRYQYDPLDRLADCAPLNQENARRFYRKNRLATEVQGQVRHSVFESEGQVLAQQRHEGGRGDSALLATDLQRSVLYSHAAGQGQPLIYSPYGHRSPENGLVSLLGFNGERQDPVTGHYLLGNGYRAFNPVLMRFNGPDSLSPFGEGGVNAYAYCLGDPVNRTDPMGHFALHIQGITQLVSAPTSVARQAGRGLRAMKNRAMDSFIKSPKQARPESSPSPIDQTFRVGSFEKSEAQLRRIGYVYKQLKKTSEPPPIARFAKARGYSESELFAQKGFRDYPDVQAQYKHSQDPEVIRWVQQSSEKLQRVTDELIQNYPDRKSRIRELVAHIRER